jgi:uncharacterized protein (TIGR03435 family)
MRLCWVILLAGGYLGAQPVFDVASVKPSDPEAHGGWVQFLPGGRLSVENSQVTFIIQQIYSVKDYQIADAPKWISDWKYRFDIQAKGDPSASREQLRLMAQALLAERFQLKVHREPREMPVYFLVAAKKGLNLHVAKDDPPRIGAGGIINISPGVKQGRKVAMNDFIRVLAGEVDRPILDKTNYTEPFDFRLEWAPDSIQPGDDGRLSLFDSLQQQLGLRLEPQRAAVEVLVIDRVEKPSVN